VPLVKLKAIYTLLEQLYSGSLRVIMAAKGGKEAPTLIKDVLKQLSTIPKQLKEWRMSTTITLTCHNYELKFNRRQMA
jgi:hypothetical protein